MLTVRSAAGQTVSEAVRKYELTHIKSSCNNAISHSAFNIEEKGEVTCPYRNPC
jgi:hypothetical protein